MNALRTFNHEMFGQVRTMTNERGETFFVGKDVAEALGYSDASKAIRVHVDSEDKGVDEMATPGGMQKVIIINESGLYSLVLSSKLEQAKAFKRWVTSEVLPQIRQTGGYIPPPVMPRAFVYSLGGTEKPQGCPRLLKSVYFR